MPDAGGADPRGASQYSTTNNQIAGVDEADFLKNDDRFLYLASHGELQILDVWPPEQAHVLSRFKVEGEVITGSCINARRLGSAIYTVVSSPELTIPGFSTYLHLMDQTHLLSTGYDAEDQGGFAWFAGVQLQIFDIADAKNPRLLHKELIGTRGTSSEALTNRREPLLLPGRDRTPACRGGGELLQLVVERGLAGEARRDHG